MLFYQTGKTVHRTSYATICVTDGLPLIRDVSVIMELVLNHPCLWRMLLLISLMEFHCRYLWHHFWQAGSSINEVTHFLFTHPSRLSCFLAIILDPSFWSPLFAGHKKKLECLQRLRRYWWNDKFFFSFFENRTLFIQSMAERQWI